MATTLSIRCRRVVALVIVALIGALTVAAGPGAGAESELGTPSTPAVLPTTERVSVATGGTEADDESDQVSVSADGRHVAFTSSATNLVPGDTNGQDDIFVYDRDTATTTRVSVASDGTEANDRSVEAAISADGRHVAFVSLATNLVSADTNGMPDVFAHDRLTGETVRLSVADDGTEANGLSLEPTISADGRFVAFQAFADNLVAGDTNLASDIIVRDRQTNTTTRASVANGATQANGLSYSAAISADGRHVAFSSMASNLVASDTNFSDDAFVHDRQTGSTTRVSVATNGTQANSSSVVGSISADGRQVAFHSWASTLVADDTNGEPDVFVHDRDTGITKRVSVATGGAEGDVDSRSAAISGDGRFVAFHSPASNLVAGDTNATRDIFVHDLLTAATERVSVASDGSEAIGASFEPALSGDGRFVAFHSDAANLVAGDTNGASDAFVHDRGGPDPVGQLRVTTNPAVPGQIIVDGIPRDSWALTWVDMAAGHHEVCFGPVSGYTPPPCEEAILAPGETTTVEGAYTQRGSLRVLTSPAVPSTITIDGHPANDWGVWTDLDPGTYEICWGPVAEMDAPPCEDAVITAGDTTTLTGEFTSSPGAPGPTGHGYLRVTTDPAVASRITIDGHLADTWGLTWLKLDPGTYQVCFEPVIHTTASSCHNAFVNSGTTTVVDGSFTPHGFLRVITDPAVGATITVDGHPANAWGVWTSREPGTYEVCYRPLPGLTAPPCEDAIVAPGDTTTLTATYT